MCLRKAISESKQQFPFQLFAICLLPDHLHTVWMLPPGDADFSVRWKRIKQLFSKYWLAGGGTEANVTPAQKKEGRRGIWQPRFWEHTVRDEQDLERCVDYIHWNPRKHELVRRVARLALLKFPSLRVGGPVRATLGRNGSTVDHQQRRRLGRARRPGLVLATRFPPGQVLAYKSSRKTKHGQYPGTLSALPDSAFTVYSADGRSLVWRIGYEVRNQELSPFP